MRCMKVVFPLPAMPTQTMATGEGDVEGELLASAMVGYSCGDSC